MKKEYAEYLLNKTKEDYNLIAHDFSRTRGKIWEEVAFLFDAGKGERVLDLGCGNARYYELLKNTRYTGIDFSEKLIEIARKKYPDADFRVQNALDLKFENETFDKVYSIAALHHIPSREFRLKFLMEARRVLKPNGKLILTVWKFRGLKYFLLKDFIKPWAKINSRYYHSFSKRELANLLSKSGFKIQKIGVIKNMRKNRQNIYAIAQKF